MNDQISIPQALSDIRQQIAALNLPKAGFAAISIKENEFQVAILGSHKVMIHESRNEKIDLSIAIVDWLKEYSQKQNMKFVAVGLCSSEKENFSKLASTIWLEMDAVPIVREKQNSNCTLEEFVREVSNRFDKVNVPNVEVAQNNKVTITQLTDETNYEKLSPSLQWQRLLSLRERVTTKKILFLSATPKGGGVATMRHALLRLLTLLGIHASWMVLPERKEVFEITKQKFHNILQGVADPSIELTAEDKELYLAWTKETAAVCQSELLAADVIVIDDPQPTGMIPQIKKINPELRIIYRSHIQIMAQEADTEGTSQHKTWQFLNSLVKDADIFISHPIRDFVPKSIDENKLLSMPPSIDLLDGLNKPLSAGQKDYYLRLFNKMLLEHGQRPLQLNRGYICQIARFDPSKGLDDLLASYKLLREKLGKANLSIPQLVIVGHSSVDDPDGLPIYNLVLQKMYSDEYEEFADDVKVLRLPHIDELFNAILQGAKVALQLSHREGFEFKITEAIYKGIPVIVYDAGGMPLQVIDGKNGFVIPTGNVELVAEKLAVLLSDQQVYNDMSHAAKETKISHLTTVANAINWLYLVNALTNGERLAGNFASVYELAMRGN